MNDATRTEEPKQEPQTMRERVALAAEYMEQAARFAELADDMLSHVIAAGLGKTMDRVRTLALETAQERDALKTYVAAQ